MLAAGFRLAAVANFYRRSGGSDDVDEDDVTWTLSLVAVWSLAEATAVVLVFALPSAPAALTHVRAMLLPSPGRRRDGKDGGTPTTTGRSPSSAWPLTNIARHKQQHKKSKPKSRHRSGSQRVYREIADADTDIDGDGGVPPSARTLTGLQPVRITASFRSEQQEEGMDGLFDNDELYKGRIRILRTTRFEARTSRNYDTADPSISDGTFCRQHPWADKRVR